MRYEGFTIFQYLDRPTLPSENSSYQIYAPISRNFSSSQLLNFVTCQPFNLYFGIQKNTINVVFAYIRVCQNYSRKIPPYSYIFHTLELTRIWYFRRNLTNKLNIRFNHLELSFYTHNENFRAFTLPYMRYVKHKKILASLANFMYGRYTKVVQVDACFQLEFHGIR